MARMNKTPGRHRHKPEVKEAASKERERFELSSSQVSGRMMARCSGRLWISSRRTMD